jgi:hypothetical protein
MMAAPGTEPHTKAIATQDLENARLMLVHAAGCGMDLPKDMVLTLSNAIQGAACYDGRNVQPVEFWVQFTALAKMLAPVTPHSLRCCAHQANGASAAMAANRRYNRWGYVVLGLLVFAQAYWFVLASVVDHFRANQDIISRHEQWHDVTRTALRHSLGREPSDVEVAAEKSKVYFATADITGSLDGAVSSLKGTKALVTPGDVNYLVAAQREALDAVANVAGWASWLMYPRYVERGETYAFNIRAKNIRDLQAARFLTDALNRYVLPMLYGLLGASLYVIRTLGSEIRRAVYTEHSNVGFNLRFFLGGIAGFAVGWLMMPPVTSDVGGTLSSIANLSPLALSFMAGYAVEIVLSVADRIIPALAAASPKAV